jgi:hypothetical protein
MPAPVGAALTGEGGRPAPAVHHMHLAALAPLVGRGEKANGILGRGTGSQQGKPTRAIVGIAKGLARDDPDSGADEGIACSDGVELARNRNADACSLSVARND